MMDPELRDQLVEQLKRRAERLAKFASMKNCPPAILAMVTEHVITTAMLLCGADVAKQMFNKAMSDRLDVHGICMCRENKLAPGKSLCQQCWDRATEEDKELNEYELLQAKTSGEPS